MSICKYFKRLKHHNQKGFTLVELMIGMVVLMIGIMATMAMQTSALAGYTATRDGTAAADLGRTVEHMIKAEATSWVGVNFDMPGPIYEGFIEGEGPDGESGVLGDASILATVNQSPWAWHRLTALPTDNNLSNRGPQRFCTYVNGGPRTPSTVIGDDQIKMTIVQIAVVYPAARGMFPKNQCPPPGDITLNANNTDELELNGLRATFFATQVYPRGN